MMKPKTFWKLAAVFVALGVGCARADEMREVNIYSFLTPAGAKLIPPTAEHPALCLIVNGGYHEEGATTAGEKPPAPDKVDALVKKALVAAHYLDIEDQKNPKELDYIIVYYCGYMNPEIEEPDDATDNSSLNFNGSMMIALVAGDSMNRMMPGTMPWQEAMQAAEEERYFVFISAYSPAAYFKNNRERKLLWRAQMSLASTGTTIDKSIAVLANSSVAYLGRPTSEPKHVIENMDRPSQVIIGTPETKEYLPGTDSAKPDNTPQK
jgi:hypothetical protein